MYGSPAHPNTLSYSPAVEARMLPWITAAAPPRRVPALVVQQLDDDVFAKPVFIFTQGDEYLVYPGTDGPMSSVRWEQLREGIEDFELLAGRAGPAWRRGHDRAHPGHRPATRNLDGRTKDANDIEAARAAVVNGLTS